VVLQEAVPIHPDDGLEDLEVRIHTVEHRLLVQALCDLLCVPGGSAGSRACDRVTD
jgi:folate-dependent phosphoribosylglycinamide formyltransferase PurN